jgi:hypothetical protein
MKLTKLLLIKKATNSTKMAKLLPFFCASLSILSLSSCVSYRNTARVGQVAETKVALINNVADVDVDFKTRIQATSAKTWDIWEAKNEAYYKAIVANNIDVLVDPIYEVKSNGKRSVATVTGYAGHYKDVRTQKQENQRVLEQNMRNDSLVFQSKLRNDAMVFDENMKDLYKKIIALEKLGQVNAVSKEDLKTYLIIGGGGCGSGGATEKTLGTSPGIVEKFTMLLNAGAPTVAASVANATSLPEMKPLAAVENTMSQMKGKGKKKK